MLVGLISSTTQVNRFIIAKDVHTVNVNLDNRSVI